MEVSPSEAFEIDDSAALQQCAPYLSSILSSPMRESATPHQKARSAPSPAVRPTPRPSTAAAASPRALTKSEDATSRHQTVDAVMGLMAELEQLREMHEREMADVKRQAAQENQRLRMWYADQLLAVEKRLQERERPEISLLRTESEQLALRTALAAARRRASAAVDDSKRGKLNQVQMAAAHEAELRALQRSARRERVNLAGSKDGELALVSARSEELIQDLRKEVKSLTAALQTAQQSVAEAEKRRHRAEEARAKAVEQLRASEEKVEALKRSLGRATPRLHASAARSKSRPPPTPSSAWH